MTDPNPTEHTGTSRRWLFAGSALVLTAGLAVAAVAATLNGLDEPQWSQERRTVPLATVEMPPRGARALAAAAGDPADEVRGVIKAQEEATIASRITARITDMPYREGRPFARGALLARFDCSQTQAQLKAAQAAAAAYRTSHETNVELDQFKAIGKNDVAVSQANLGKAIAEANAVSAQLTDCAIFAPFAGTVVEEVAHPREVAASGQPIMKIQSGGTMEIELIVPSRWLTWLKPGEAFRFKIDETGEDAAGIVTRFGAAVDAVSKTIRVTGSIKQSTGLVLPGMSGSATFARSGTDPRVVHSASPVARGKSS